MTISERDSKVIWHPFTQAQTAPPNIAIVKSEGCWLIDENNKRYLDATASWWVNAHGHANPAVTAALTEQASLLEHIIFAGFTHLPAVELAEKVLELLPGNFSRIFYSDNGSTSVEVALKMCLQYFFNKGEKRNRFIAFHNAYHGDTFGSMSVGARNAFNLPFEDLLFQVDFIDAPEAGKEDESLRQFRQALGPHTAGFIFEPLIQGAAGMRTHQAAPLSEMIALCRKNGSLSIADEVFTGFYRTGKIFACSYLSEHPDLMCLSKTLTGGVLPLGITAAPEFIYDAFISSDKRKTFFHGHSFTANPLSCKVALTSLQLLQSENCRQNIRRICESHLAFAEQVRQHPSVMEVRPLGTILAIELHTHNERGYLNPIAEQISAWFLNRGIYLRSLGNVLYITPPYVITGEELQLVYNSVNDFLQEITNP